jgi:hypothetical protein
MSESHDLSIRVTGQCIGALVVNKLTADINSRNIPVSIDELACLSAILGTKTDNVTLLLNHRGAIEFTSVLFIALAHVSSLDCQKVPLDTCHVLQQTLNVLSRALPSELNAKMWLYQTDTFNISGSECELVLLQSCLRGLKIPIRGFISYDSNDDERTTCVDEEPVGFDNRVQWTRELSGFAILCLHCFHQPGVVSSYTPG